VSRFSLVMRLALALLLGLAVPSTTFADESPRPSPLPVHGMPRILAVSMPDNLNFHAGQTVRGSVETSPNVGYVEARIQYRGTPFHQDGVGKFSLAYTIPWWLPPWLRHKWTLQIIARSVDGVEVKQEFPIRVE